MSELMYQRLKENLETLKMKTILQTLDNYNYPERAVQKKQLVANTLFT